MGSYCLKTIYIHIYIYILWEVSFVEIFYRLFLLYNRYFHSIVHFLVVTAEIMVTREPRVYCIYGTVCTVELGVSRFYCCILCEVQAIKQIEPFIQSRK